MGAITIAAERAMAGGPPDHELIAFRVADADVEVAPAPRWRDWMNATQDRFANRCLPLLVANQAGWVLLNPVAFEATWNGGDTTDDVAVEYAGGEEAPRLAESMFGYGIVSWTIPYLFRTPPGYDLLARGPANLPKDGATALEGLIETEWAVVTFTMNWKLTRPDHPVRFEAEEPFCMIVPCRRGDLESFRPEIRDVESDTRTADGYRQFRNRRKLLAFSKDYAGSRGHDRYPRKEWQPEYFKGQEPDGTPSPVHRTTLELAPFTKRTRPS